MTSLSKGFALVLSLLSVSSTVACADYPSAESAEGHRDQIVVVGVGKLTAKPDVARINIGIESRAAAVTEANQQNAEQMNRLIAALKSVPIEDKDIQTSNFSVYFERIEEPMPVPIPAPAPAAEGGKKSAATKAAPTAMPAGPTSPPDAGVMSVRGFYRVSNTVQITVRDLSKVGQVLDTAISTGANNIHGVHFELENDKELQAKLRELAVADASARAAELAKLGRLQLGDVRAISEVIGGRGVGPMAASLEYAKMSSPIEAGELTFEGRIEVVYGIKR